MGHFGRLKERHERGFEEIITQYKKLASENIKARVSMQGELNKHISIALKGIQDENNAKLKENDEKVRKAEEEKNKKVELLGKVEVEKAGLVR
jgi:hypothetical protein